MVGVGVCVVLVWCVCLCVCVCSSLRVPPAGGARLGKPHAGGGGQGGGAPGEPEPAPFGGLCGMARVGRDQRERRAVTQ